MAKIIKCTLSDENVEKLKKIYETTKVNIPVEISNFDEFLEWTVNTAILTHIQLSSINEKMFNFLDGKNSMDNIDYESVNEFVNNLFKGDEKDPKKPAATSTDSLKSSPKKKPN